MIKSSDGVHTTNNVAASRKMQPGQDQLLSIEQQAKLGIIRKSSNMVDAAKTDTITITTEKPSVRIYQPSNTDQGGLHHDDTNSSDNGIQ